MRDVRNLESMLPPLEMQKGDLSLFEKLRERRACRKKWQRSQSFGCRLRFVVRAPGAEFAQQFEIENRKGVIVTQVEEGSPADDAGFQEGDIVRSINRQPVKNVQEFGALLKKLKGEKTALFLVERGDARVFLAVKIK